MGDNPIRGKQKSKTPISPTSEKQSKLRPISSRIFSAAEHGWCQLMLGILALFFGIVDGRYITIISVMAILAIHRSDSLKGLGRWKQATVYTATFCLIFVALWIGGVEWNKDRDNSPLIKAIADMVGAKIGKPLPSATAGPPPPAPIVPAVAKSYLEYSGMPVFAGASPSGAEGVPFSVGDPLGFNVHFRAIGPNPVILLHTALDTEVVTDLHMQNDMYDPTPISKAVDSSLLEIRKQEAKLIHKKPAPHTLMVGDSEYFTAYAWTDDYSKHRFVTQSDLDNVRNRSETFVVISILTYLDGKTTHHLRRCMWLMPPGIAPGLWHFCDGNFPDSD